MTMVKHFDLIAPMYRSLRKIHYSPVDYLSRFLDHSSLLYGLEMGCGTGRYSELLLNHLSNLFLVCNDCSKGMLHELERNLQSRGIKHFEILQKRAEELSFPKNTFDMIFSFNAIHHFDLKRLIPFIEESIRPGGWIFIYTRLPSQNRRSVWGQCFPEFAQKETRLYTEEQLRSHFKQSPQLCVNRVVEFQYPRRASLGDLLERADNAYYSTFCFYTPSEYKTARARFIKNLQKMYDDPGNITWTDRNILFIIRKVL